MDKAVTTCRLPLNRGISSYLKVPVHPTTTHVYKETTYIPPGTPTLRIDKQEYGQTQRNDELPPQP